MRLQKIYDTSDKIEYHHGGLDYDKGYPRGIPTRVVLETEQGHRFDSDKVMFPFGHASCKDYDLEFLLKTKW